MGCLEVCVGWVVAYGYPGDEGEVKGWGFPLVLACLLFDMDFLCGFFSSPRQTVTFLHICALVPSPDFLVLSDIRHSFPTRAKERSAVVVYRTVVFIT